MAMAWAFDCGVPFFGITPWYVLGEDGNDGEEDLSSPHFSPAGPRASSSLLFLAKKERKGKEKTRKETQRKEEVYVDVLMRDGWLDAGRVREWREKRAQGGRGRLMTIAVVMIDRCGISSFLIGD